jgi:hypothetical protein
VFGAVKVIIKTSTAATVSVAATDAVKVATEVIPE